MTILFGDLLVRVLVIVSKYPTDSIEKHTMLEATKGSVLQLVSNYQVLESDFYL